MRAPSRAGVLPKTRPATWEDHVRNWRRGLLRGALFCPPRKDPSRRSGRHGRIRTFLSGGRIRSLTCRPALIPSTARRLRSAMGSSGNLDATPVRQRRARALSTPPRRPSSTPARSSFSQPHVLPGPPSNGPLRMSSSSKPHHADGTRTLWKNGSSSEPTHGKISRRHPALRSRRVPRKSLNFSVLRREDAHPDRRAHSNQKLHPTGSGAAHSVLWPLCLLSQPAAEFCVGPAEGRRAAHFVQSMQKQALDGEHEECV